MSAADHEPLQSSMESVAVIGAGGYTGRELIRLILGHGRMRLVATYGSSSSDCERTVSSEHPSLRGLCELPIEPWKSCRESMTSRIDTAFLATPHEVSDQIASDLVQAGVRVIDLSGAFRLADHAAHANVYGYERRDPSLCERAVYAIPELTASPLRDAPLISCAGCYATAAQLSIRPLVNADLVEMDTVIVDAISGVSGAGRSPNQKHLLTEVSHRPYGLPVHRHESEIIEYSGIDVVFTPHLAPVDRGILSTAHLVLRSGVGVSDIRAAFSEAYDQWRLVRVLPDGVPPEMASVVRTPFADLSWCVDSGRSRVRVFAALDNLLKGASSQAIQCWNIANGLPDWYGLIDTAAQIPSEPAVKAGV